jgi:hypothetical protein
LGEHAVSTVYELGWAELDNGQLLRTAQEGFDLLLTTDQNLQHQQNLSDIALAILVLPTTSWPRIQRHASEVVTAVNTLQPGEYRELRF